MNITQYFVNILSSKFLLRLYAFFRGEISSVRENSLEIIRFHIDKPNKVFNTVKSSFPVSGWCVDLRACSAAKLRIRVGKRVYQPFIVPRPEVSSVFASVCTLPKDVGFICMPLVPFGLHRMRIDIQNSEGKWISVRRALLLNIHFLFKRSRRKVPYDSGLSMKQKKLKIDNGFNQTVAVAYIVRGADKNWLLSCKRFIDSYKNNSSGTKHILYVIFKGFSDTSDLKKAKSQFNFVSHKPIFLGDDSFDIGAYIEWANMIDEKFICVFNSASEILGEDWLLKLATNLMLPNVGLVGATGSYESLKALYTEFPSFPNAHIRSTAFMIEREYFCRMTKNIKIGCKKDAHRFESSHKSLNRKILSDGKKILVVGRNGYGYSPKLWPVSGTFRQGKQENLLVADNQTKIFNGLPLEMKKYTIFHTWGVEYVEIMI